MFASDKSAGIVAKWLMGLLLLFVQLHICQAEYTLPGGETCFTCPTLDQDDHIGTQVELSSQKHGDCHDCCEVKPCDEGGKDTAALAQALQFNLVFALPPTIPTINFLLIEEPVAEFEFLEGCPPTGPPATSKSRAPPASSNA